jgi:molybdopterin/thiamine biosynthesis adenylyltransferase
MTADYWRQADLVRPEDLDFPVVVIGAGGIGSPTTLILAKMGCRRITAFDPDIIEAHNLPNQLYRPVDLGLPKSIALRSIVEELTGVTIDANVSEAPDPLPQGVVVTTVDSMAARQRIWATVKRSGRMAPLYLEARMGGEVGRVYAVIPSDPDHVAAYEQTLYDDEASDPDPCSNQAIIYSVFVIAGLIAARLRSFAVAEAMPVETIIDLRTNTLITQAQRSVVHA